MQAVAHALSAVIIECELVANLPEVYLLIGGGNVPGTVVPVFKF